MVEGQKPGTGGLGSDSFQSQGAKKPGSGALALPGWQAGATRLPSAAPAQALPSRASSPLGTGGLGKAPVLPAPTEAALRQEVASHAQFEALMAPRMRFLGYVLGLKSRSGPALKLALAKQKPDIAQMAEALLGAIARDPGLVQRLEEAIQRVAQAATLAREAEERLARWDELPPELASGALLGFDLPTFKRAIYWMSTLDANFADQAVLAQLFPPVARQGSLDPVQKAAALVAQNKGGLAKGPHTGALQGDRPLQQAAKSSPLAPRGDPASLAAAAAKPSQLAQSASPWLGRAVQRLEHWLAEATEAK